MNQPTNKSPAFLWALSDLNSALGHTSDIFFYDIPQGDARRDEVIEASRNIARALAILERL